MKTKKKDPFHVILGARIREARIQAGMQQKDLADALGVEVGSVSGWETGATGTTVKHLAAIAKLTKCSGAWLLPSPLPAPHSPEKILDQLVEIVGVRRIGLLIALKPERLRKDLEQLIGAHISDAQPLEERPRGKR